MYIMLKDEPVMYFDVDKGIYNVLREDLLPYSLRGAFKATSQSMSVEERGQCDRKNWSTLISFLSKRVLSLDRENAKKLLNAYNLSQSQDPVERAKIAITCKAVSMIDDYWLNDDKLSIKWDSMNPKKVHLNEIVSHIMLFGKSLTATGEPHTPELTGHGAYAKSWMRTDEGLYLFKKGSIHGMESEIEVSVSEILDCFNVSHVKYEGTVLENTKLCRCKNMATDDYCIVPAEEVYSYCSRNNLDFLQYSLTQDADAIYKMCIVDYLVSNSDRHLMNWGFYMSNETGNLLGCHPLFDHNNAFDKSLMHQEDGGNNLVFNKTMRESAIYAMKHCDFRCVAPVTRKMFLNDEMYQSFMERAVELGLYKKVKRNIWEKLGFKQRDEYEPVQLRSNNVSEKDIETVFAEDKQRCEDNKRASSRGKGIHRLHTRNHGIGIVEELEQE